MMIPESELVLNPDGSVYHLKLKPGELANDILLVGDPARVDEVASHFDSIEFKREKREFRTATGRIGTRRLSVISTGIGTDNVDIVFSEVDALLSIDFDKREPFSVPQKARFLRLGTCGGLQPELEPGSLVYSEFAIGMDSLMGYYQFERTTKVSDLERKFNQFLRSTTALNISAYAAQASSSITQKLKQQFPSIAHGITLTACGFYGPQGRYIQRAKPLEPRLVDLASTFSWEGNRVLNLEMETSAILAFGSILGHETASVCVVLANRPKGLFHPDPDKAVQDVIQAGIELILA